MQKTKPKPKPALIFKNCSYVCTYHCAQLSYTTQHRTVLIIFPYPPDNHHCSGVVYGTRYKTKFLGMMHMISLEQMLLHDTAIRMWLTTASLPFHAFSKSSLQCQYTSSLH